MEDPKGEREKGLRPVSKAAIQERHMVVFNTSNIQIQRVVISLWKPNRDSAKSELLSIKW